jgi:ribose-phosphate pyrophosphokinase
VNKPRTPGKGPLIMGKRGTGANNDFKWLRIFTGNSNIELIRKIAERLKTTIGRSVVKNFSDGEINVEIDESVRGMDVFVIQSVCDPVNSNLMELLIMIDAMKRASADRITADGTDR